MRKLAILFLLLLISSRPFSLATATSLPTIAPTVMLPAPERCSITVQQIAHEQSIYRWLAMSLVVGLNYIGVDGERMEANISPDGYGWWALVIQAPDKDFCDLWHPIFDYLEFEVRP